MTRLETDAGPTLTPLQAGDQLLLAMREQNLRHEDAERLMAELRERFPAVEVIVVAGVEAMAVRRAAAADDTPGTDGRLDEPGEPGGPSPG